MDRQIITTKPIKGVYQKAKLLRTEQEATAHGSRTARFYHDVEVSYSGNYDVVIDWSGIAALAKKAATSKGKQATDGPVQVRVRLTMQERDLGERKS